MLKHRGFLIAIENGAETLEGLLSNGWTIQCDEMGTQCGKIRLYHGNKTFRISALLENEMRHTSVVNGTNGMIAAIPACLSSDPAPPSMTGRKPRDFYTTKKLIKDEVNILKWSHPGQSVSVH